MTGRVRVTTRRGCGGRPGRVGETRLLYRILGALPVDLDSGTVFINARHSTFTGHCTLVGPSFAIRKFSNCYSPITVCGSVRPGDRFAPRQVSALHRFATGDHVISVLGRACTSTRGCAGRMVFFIRRIANRIVPSFHTTLGCNISGLVTSTGSRGARFRATTTVTLGNIGVLVNHCLRLVTGRGGTYAIREESRLRYLRRTLGGVGNNTTNGLCRTLRLCLLL